MKKSILLFLPMLLLLSCTGNKSQNNTQDKSSPLKVISYNIRMTWNAEGDGENRWENRRGATLKMISEQQPQLLGLQEACPPQIAFLDSCLSGYRRIGVGRDDGILEGEMMAIYYDTTRLELGKNGTFWLSQTPDSVSLGWDGMCKRTCTWGIFADKQSGKSFLYMNTHFDHIGKIAREESIKLIVDRIASSVADTVPVLLSADFNSDTKNDIFLPLKAVLDDAREKSPMTDKAPTYNGFGNIPESDVNNEQEVLIDHIFYRHATPKSFEVLDGNYGVPYISDHYPISFILEF